MIYLIIHYNIFEVTLICVTLNVSFSFNEEENLMETNELYCGSTSQDEKMGFFFYLKTSNHISLFKYICLS